MFLISGFAATQADATTTQVFNQAAGNNAGVFIGGATTAQFTYRFDGQASLFSTNGNSALGAKDSGTLPTAATVFTSPAEEPTGVFTFDAAQDIQVRFDLNGVTNYGLARFGSASGGADLQQLASIEYAPAAAAAPEPEGWAMMIAGFGAAGGALRASRRRARAAIAA